MTKVRPFRGVRPHQHNAADVVSRPYDAYSANELREILDNDEQSFLHVIKPEHGQAEQSPVNSPTLFAKSKNRFLKFVEEDVLTMELSPSFYVYTQHVGEQTFTGFIACAAVEDYDSGVIRIHEQTIASREKLLKEYLNVCDINAEPVCFTYPRSESIQTITNAVKQTTPLLDFFHDDGKRHQLWCVSDIEIIQQFEDHFAKLEHIYIADGHHRTASSVLLAHERWKQASANRSADASHNYFLGIFFPDDQLRIFEFNRVVRNIGHDSTSFISALQNDFEVVNNGQLSVKPDRPGCFGLYMGSCWYKLTYRHPPCNDVVGALDVSILSDHILGPILGINDLRNDDRIGFVPGIKGSNELERLVNSGKYQMAFSLFPVTGEAFYAISDQGRTMPPKSTYVVPKLLNGLVIYSLSHC
jgi:uncharacterized protein (DUF1015 family)